MNFCNVFNVMCCVWALVLQSLTLSALMIKVTSLKGWLCLQIGQMLGTTVGLKIFFLCTDLKTLCSGLHIVGNR